MVHYTDPRAEEIWSTVLAWVSKLGAKFVIRTLLDIINDLFDTL